MPTVPGSAPAHCDLSELVPLQHASDRPELPTLEKYLTSERDVRLHAMVEWQSRPDLTPGVREPRDIDRQAYRRSRRCCRNAEQPQARPNAPWPTFPGVDVFRL